MQRIGLYYPHTHFRSERWIKAAALYWPRMGRVVPSGYPVNDSPVVAALKDELGFVIDVDPRGAIEAAAPVFMQLLHDTWGSAAVRHRFLATEGSFAYTSGYSASEDTWYVRVGGIPPVIDSEASLGATWGYEDVPDRRLAGLYWDEVAPVLREALIGEGLAVPVLESPSSASSSFRVKRLALPPELAWCYKCILTEELARQTQFAPATDQDEAHGMLGNWDVEAISSACMGYSLLDPERMIPSRMGLMAVQSVLPEDLDDVPVEKIVKLRRRYAAEFDHFTELIAAAAADLESNLGGVRDAVAVQEYIRLELDRVVRTPLRELEKAMRGLHINTATGVLNYKFELGSVATVLAGLFGHGPVTWGGVALGVATMRQGVSEARDAQLKSSPVGFLLRVRHGLQPGVLVRSLNRIAERRNRVGE